jgi:hypothetical protein
MIKPFVNVLQLLLNAQLVAIVVGLALLPGVSATHPPFMPFPDMRFSAFAEFIEDNFSTQITLATVLTLLFSLTDNIDLLNLHFRQQHPRYHGEKRQEVTGWMKAFIWTLQTNLGNRAQDLFCQSDNPSHLSTEAENKLLGQKMNRMAKCLGLDPYNERGQLVQWLTPISKDKIAPVRLLCPQSAQCETATCDPRALLQHIRERDMPLVTLLEGTQERQHVAVLTGRCTTCQVSMVIQ